MIRLRRWPDYPNCLIPLVALAACVPAALYELFLDNPHGILFHQFKPAGPVALRSLAAVCLLALPVGTVAVAGFLLGYRRRLAGVPSAAPSSALVLPLVAGTGLLVVFLRDQVWRHFPGTLRYAICVDQTVRDLFTYHVHQALFAGFAAVLLLLLAQFVGRMLASWRIRRGKAEFAPWHSEGLFQWAVTHPACAAAWTWIAVFGTAVLAAGTLGLFENRRWDAPTPWWYTAADFAAQAAMPIAVLTGALLIFLRTLRGIRSRLAAVALAAFAICALCGALARARAFQAFWSYKPFLYRARVGYPAIVRDDYDYSRFRVSGVMVDLAAVEKVVWSQGWLSNDARRAIVYLEEPVLLGLAFAALWAGPILGVLGLAWLAGRIVRRRRARQGVTARGADAPDTGREARPGRDGPRPAPGG